MPTIKTSSKHTVAFLLHKKTGRQLDLTACDVEITEIANYVNAQSYSSGERHRVLHSVDTVVKVNKSVKWGEPSLLAHFDTLGTEWILNIGQEEDAFHLPLHFNEGMSESFVRNSYDIMQFIGLGARVAGLHNIGEFLRFDVGDGTYQELYMATPELVTPKQYIERWYNKQGVWKW